MKPIKFTDLHKFPHGYTPSAGTNVARTIARERARLKVIADAQASERQTKVAQIKRVAK